ncbi:MAG: helix-turn-helix domain-containing protein [Bacteroidota bacterium]
MVSVIHILKINEVKDHQIYCVFSNGEYRFIDFSELLKKWEVKQNDLLYHLNDVEQLNKVVIDNATLTWPSIKKNVELSNGAKFEVNLDIDPVVLYENSEIDRERDSAYILGKALREARLSTGLTQAELAQKVGTSKSYISKIENSKSDIGYKTLRKIVEVGLNKRLIISD